MTLEQWKDPLSDNYVAMDPKGIVTPKLEPIRL
mgnify:CR=1 FL=1